MKLLFIEIFVSKGKQERKNLKEYVGTKGNFFVLFEILVFSVWIEFTEEFLGLKMTLNHEAETYFKVLSSMDLWWKPHFPLSPSVIKENAE